MFNLCLNVQGLSAMPPCSCCACHSVLLHIYRLETGPLNHHVENMLWLLIWTFILKSVSATFLTCLILFKDRILQHFHG